MSVSNAMKATLALTAESIDLTSFYNQLTGGTKPAATNTAATAAKASVAAQPTAAATPTEPDAISVPISLATVNLKIGKFVLGEIEITNWQTGIRIESNSHFVINPFKLVLNGAPVSFTLDADTSKPGYRYSTSFNLDKVPLEPLANTFMASNKGAYKGIVIASADIKGSGVTDAHLRDNLSGKYALIVTNASIQITNTGGFASQVLSLLEPIVSAFSKVSASSTVSQITTDPLNSLSSSGAIGQGKINLDMTRVQSVAFYADVHGDVTMTVPITNSPLNMPVTFALSQSIAKKIPYLTDISSDANAAYVTIPDFVKLGGTLGKPATKATLPSTQALLNVAEGLGKKLGGTKASGIIDSVNGILGRPSSTTTNSTPSTTTPATNTANPVNNLLNNFLRGR